MSFRSQVGARGDTANPLSNASLVHLLRTNPSSQMQYQLGFCFWLLTFDTPIASELNAFVLFPLLPCIRAHSPVTTANTTLSR